ncbi:MAG: hypothetical protein ACYCWW_10885, partial [Deltaproteobacteria bacterium]
ERELLACARLSDLPTPPAPIPPRESPQGRRPLEAPAAPRRAAPAPATPRAAPPRALSRRAIETPPGRPTGWLREAGVAFEEGRAAEARGDDAGAIGAYRRALALSPREARFLERAAHVLLRRPESLPEAKRYADLAVDLAPEDPDSLATAGQVYLRLGMSHRARRYAETLDRVAPDHPGARELRRRLRSLPL